MIRVNLLQIREELRRAAVRNFLILSGLLIVVAILVAFTWHSGIQSDVKATQVANKQLQEQITKLKSLIGDVEKLKKQKEDMEAKKNTIQRLELDRKVNVAVINEISQIVPTELWLDQLVIEGKSILLKGRSVDNQIIGAFFTAIQNSVFFENLVYGPNKQTDGPGGLKLFNFELEATIAQLTPENFVTDGELQAAQEQEQ